MTIKQQGGIFGRNPTFNNVDIEGTLTVNGEPISDFGTMAQQDADAVAITGGTASLDGLTVDTNTLHVDAAGNKVGIGTTSPYTLLELSSTDPVFRFNDSNGGVDTKNFEMRYVGTSSPNIDGLYFRTVNDANTVYSDKMVILGDGNVEVKTGNLVIGTSGKGIDFSATSGTGTSELFDDYEEGTWTPQLLTDAGSSAGKVYSVQDGVYTKIGKTVIATFTVAFDGSAGASGLFNLNEANVAGFPYAMASATPMGGFITEYSGTGININTISLQPVGAGATKAYFWVSSTPGTSNSFAVQTLYTDSSRFQGIAIYNAA